VNWLDNMFTFGLDDRKGETLSMFAQHCARELSDEAQGSRDSGSGTRILKARIPNPENCQKSTVRFQRTNRGV
jgi:hypothetical protein